MLCSPLRIQKLNHSNFLFSWFRFTFLLTAIKFFVAHFYMIILDFSKGDDLIVECVYQFLISEFF